MVTEQIILDISKWQGDINPQTMWDAGVRVIKLRATIGNYYQDTHVRTYTEQLRALGGIKIGYYHVVRPDNSASSQVDNLFALLDSMGFRGDIPITIDDEVDKWTDRFGVRHHFPATQVSQRARQVTEMIELRDGRIPEYYVSWNHARTNHAVNNSWLLRYPLHVPWYGSTNWLGQAIENNEESFMARERVTDFRIPEPWYSAWKRGEIDRPYNLWQGTDRALGSKWGTSSNNTVDLNKPWPGLDYNNLYGGDIEPPPPAEPMTDEERDAAIRELQRDVAILRGYHTNPAPPITPPINNPPPTSNKVKFDITGNHSGPIDAYDRPHGNKQGWFGRNREVRDTGERFMGNDWMRVQGTINTGANGKFWISKDQATLVPVE